MKFRKKPVVVEARQWDGSAQTAIALIDWMGCGVMLRDLETMRPSGVTITTLEDGNGVAKHVASPGDWVIRGIKGEFYPCKPDIFEATYESAEV